MVLNQHFFCMSRLFLDHLRMLSLLPSLFADHCLLHLDTLIKILLLLPVLLRGHLLLLAYLIMPLLLLLQGLVVPQLLIDDGARLLACLIDFFEGFALLGLEETDAVE